MTRRIRHLEPYGYREQDSFNAVSVSKMASDIENIKVVNAKQDSDISSKTVTIDENEEREKYIVYQGGKEIGEINFDTFIDHAKVVELTDPETGVMYKALRIYLIADEEKAERLGKYADIPLRDIMKLNEFETSDTIAFSSRTVDNSVIISASIVDGSVTKEKLSEDVVKILDSNGILVKSEEEGIRAEVKSEDGSSTLLKIGDDGVLYLIVEGELMNVNDLLAQLAHETYGGDGGSTYNP